MDKNIDKIGIIGTGKIGIAAIIACLNAKYKVLILDINQKIAKDAYNKIKKYMGDKNLNDCAIASDIKDFSDCRLLFETISENEQEKINIIKKCDAYMNDNAILATSTSSLSVTKLGALLKEPKNFVGMHFMHPQTSIAGIVEIVRGIETSNETCQNTKLFIQSLDKKPIISADCPGFLVNRLLMPLINEAAFLLQEGIGNAKSIDDAMPICLDNKTFPLQGPLRMADIIGLDICLHMIKTLAMEGNTKYRPCPLMVKYVEAGWLGVKTKKGFYNYLDGKIEPMPTR